jgi:uncharacterized protein DUF6677
MDQPNDQVVSPSEPAPFQGKPMSLAATLAICGTSWLVPGLGHILIGRWIRGLILAASVLLMFGLGLAMQGKLYDLEFDDLLHMFAFVANVGIGIPYWIAGRLGYGIGTMTAPSFDYGTTYLWVCGLLNYLIILDVFDIAQGRKP